MTAPSHRQVGCFVAQPRVAVQRSAEFRNNSSPEPKAHGAHGSPAIQLTANPRRKVKEFRVSISFLQIRVAADQGGSPLGRLSSQAVGVYIAGTTRIFIRAMRVRCPSLVDGHGSGAASLRISVR